MRSELTTSAGTSRSTTDVTKRTWQFSTLNELHVHVNALLRQAMLNERYKRWRKVIELYKDLIWTLSLKNFPSDYEPPSSYSMLLYELHFHLGVAYQHMNNHSKATKEFSKAIEVVSITKNGCLAGCLTNSCLMTPIYTRRAYAYAKLGSYRLSLKDAEQAVVLDSQSSDVYCIRALVRSTFDDELMGLKDLEKALKLDPNHICATVLKASFTKPLVTDENEQYGCSGKLPRSSDSKKFARLRAKALRLMAEADTYLNCNSFHHPCIQEFYDKYENMSHVEDLKHCFTFYWFLFPLSVPHTLTRINLKPEKPSKKQLDSHYVQSKLAAEAALDGDAGDTGRPKTAHPDVFRCGTTHETANKRISWKRRMDYGNALRKHVGRPKSASEFFAQLEKQRRMDTQQRRTQSALVRPGDRFARLSKPPTAEGASLGKTGTAVNQTGCATMERASAISKMGSRPFTAPTGGRVSSLSGVKSVTLERPQTSTHASGTQGVTQTANDDKESYKKLQPKKVIVIETPQDYSIPVFQAVNIESAPRMYYKPWIGDKLPVKEKSEIKWSPPFY